MIYYFSLFEYSGGSVLYFIHFQWKTSVKKKLRHIIYLLI